MNAERVEKMGLGANIVSNRNQRKIRAVNKAGLRIDRAGSRRAISGAQDIDADYKIMLKR